MTTTPELLDILKVPFKQNRANCFQCENFLIDDEYYWENIGTYSKDNLYDIIDHPNDLWGISGSSFYGIRDRVNECMANVLENSLYLITPTQFEIDVGIEGAEFGNPRRKVRANFQYNGVRYIFSATDSSIEKYYLQKGLGNYTFNEPENRVFLCVSIGLPWQGYCYKFVASVIVL